MVFPALMSVTSSGALPLSVPRTASYCVRRAPVVLPSLPGPTNLIGSSPMLLASPTCVASKLGVGCRSHEGKP